MQLNTKEKQRCLAFLHQMKAQPNLLPFSQRCDAKFGYSDFELIVDKKLDFQII